MEPTEKTETGAAADQSAAGGAAQGTENDGAAMAQFGRAELAALADAHGAQFADLAQLRQSQDGGRVLRLWQSGVPMADAWAAVHFKEIAARGQEAMRQSALNAVLGKQHLTPTGGGASEETPVPAEVYEQYKAMLPGFSDAQIRASWRSYRSR